MTVGNIIIPDEFAADIQKAVSILKNEGCTEVYIFGSLVHRDYHENSDIDLAVKGLPAKKYFKVVGKLLIEVETSVDLVDLDDKNSSFAKMLEEKGELIRVA